MRMRPALLPSMASPDLPIFSDYLMNGTVFGKKNRMAKCVV
jgi:hypothetical protein